ncbi:hypothetical protein TRVL_02263 [Trypanosoma vivax]|nr:hypothetical protein TRVL_02263 [Trypanosoma vivax]
MPLLLGRRKRRRWSKLQKLIIWGCEENVDGATAVVTGGIDGCTSFAHRRRRRETAVRTNVRNTLLQVKKFTGRGPQHRGIWARNLVAALGNPHSAPRWQLPSEAAFRSTLIHAIAGGSGCGGRRRPK